MYLFYIVWLVLFELRFWFDDWLLLYIGCLCVCLLLLASAMKGFGYVEYCVAAWIRVCGCDLF